RHRRLRQRLWRRGVVVLARAAAGPRHGRARDERDLLRPGGDVLRLRASPAGRAFAERLLMPLFDRKDKSRYATFTRRTLIMSGGMTAVLCALGGRLYQLQIRDGDLYRTAAEDNRVNERLVAPPRGRILDRFGVELANNRRNYRLLLVAELADQADGGTARALESVAR